MSPAAKATGSETMFRAGQSVEIKGIYRVIHYAHRLPHETAVLALKKFPSCKHCGDRVRFQLVRSVGELLRDYDFQQDDETC